MPQQQLEEPLRERHRLKGYQFSQTSEPPGGGGRHIRLDKNGLSAGGLRIAEGCSASGAICVDGAVSIVIGLAPCGRGSDNDALKLLRSSV